CFVSGAFSKQICERVTVGRLCVSVGWLGLSVLVASLRPVLAQVQPAVTNLAEQITQTKISSGSILWAGTNEPNAVETAAVWAIVDQFKDGRAPTDLEAFVQSYPDSAWTPSVRAHLGWSYRQQGRHTLAL